MWMQEVNKSDTERAWVIGSNVDGQTITAHTPVFKFLSKGNAASVSTNEVASRGAIVGGAALVPDAVGSFIGLAYEDIANLDAQGVIQVYGYHESAQVMLITANVTVVPGHALGPITTAASPGLSSIGITDRYGPVTALDTITAIMHSTGTAAAPLYANHVFIRAL
jgi:hypothetical protein